MSKTEQLYMKTGAASIWLGVSRRWLTQLADNGAIPFAQVGTRTRLFKISDLESWIERNTIGGAQ